MARADAAEKSEKYAEQQVELLKGNVTELEVALKSIQTRLKGKTDAVIAANSAVLKAKSKEEGAEAKYAGVQAALGEVKAGLGKLRREGIVAMSEECDSLRVNIYRFVSAFVAGGGIQVRTTPSFSLSLSLFALN